MSKYSLTKNFSFVEFHMKEHKYTDNRTGAPRNFIGYLKKGYCKIVSSHKVLELKEGDLFYIPIGFPYESYWYPSDGDLIYISLGFLNLEVREGMNYELQQIPCDEVLRRKFLSIPLGNPVTCTALSRFYDVLSEIFPVMERETLGKKHAIVELAQRYVDEHPDCSIPDIAKACYISEPYLYLLFKRVLGTTPNEYRQEQLCEKGVELLTTTNKSIEEISDLLGFSSCSYFRKILKKHVGATPREIRKKGAL